MTRCRARRRPGRHRLWSGSWRADRCSSQRVESRGDDLGVVKAPIAVLERRAAASMRSAKAPLGVEAEHLDADQRRLSRFAPVGVHDRLAVNALLPNPQARRSARRAAEQLRLDPIGLALHRGRERGCRALTTTIPIADAINSGGAMNCQTETPAARATTSSSLRDKLRNEIIAPNSTAKGSACSATIGVCNSDSQRHQRPGRAAACRRSGAASRRSRWRKSARRRRRRPRERSRRTASAK